MKIRPIGWGIVATAIAFILLIPSFFLGAFLEFGLSGEPQTFSYFSLLMVLIMFLSIPTAIVIEVGGWISGKIFGDSEEERKDRELELKEEESSMDKLDKLNDLREKGAISQEEFESKKRDLLDQM